MPLSVHPLKELCHSSLSCIHSLYSRNFSFLLAIEITQARAKWKGVSPWALCVWLILLEMLARKTWILIFLFAMYLVSLQWTSGCSPGKSQMFSAPHPTPCRTTWKLSCQDADLPPRSKASTLIAQRGVDHSCSLPSLSESGRHIPGHCYLFLKSWDSSHVIKNDSPL